eukprot:GHVT01023943.1.p1 GENE.GHVT01023943.1~~GHVT01023943.1.p1  ORF type:complete len:162 (+),score=36.13 GHVT01023943.1:837-1322(+)
MECVATSSSSSLSEKSWSPSARRVASHRSRRTSRRPFSFWSSSPKSSAPHLASASSKLAGGWPPASALSALGPSGGVVALEAASRSQIKLNNAGKETSAGASPGKAARHGAARPPLGEGPTLHILLTTSTTSSEAKKKEKIEAAKGHRLGHLLTQSSADKN